MKVDRNTIVKNIFDERIESNALWAKVDLVMMLEYRLAAIEKAKSYIDHVRDTTIKAKELAKGAYREAEANRKKAKDALFTLHLGYKNVETKMNQV